MPTWTRNTMPWSLKLLLFVVQRLKAAHIVVIISKRRCVSNPLETGEKGIMWLTFMRCTGAATYWRVLEQLGQGLVWCGFFWFAFFKLVFFFVFCFFYLPPPGRPKYVNQPQPRSKNGITMFIMVDKTLKSVSLASVMCKVICSTYGQHA